LATKKNTRASPTNASTSSEKKSGRSTRAIFVQVRVGLASFLLLMLAACSPAPEHDRGLDPRGRVHVAIGIPGTVDTLKTFVEAEGGFSPGVGSYGISFWLYDGKLTAPTVEHVRVAYGGMPIPWSEWRAGDVVVRSELCWVQRAPNQFVTAARVMLTNRGAKEARVSLFAVLRALGPAGWPVHAMSVDDGALFVDGQLALEPNVKPSAAGVANDDRVGVHAARGEVPRRKKARSRDGNASGALRFEITLAAGASRTIGFVAPVLPGRRATGHRWDETAEARLDTSVPNSGGVLQRQAPRGLNVDALFTEATTYWDRLLGSAAIETPDRRWNEAFAAIPVHIAMTLDEGSAPDAAIVNYNTFTRDAVYSISVLDHKGMHALAEGAIDYLFAHPFSGRAQPEADNPGQVLWIAGEHWNLTRDRAWLARVQPQVVKLAKLIERYRTTPEPHYVEVDGKQKRLVPGACDGVHPEYTEAFDIAGLRAAALLTKDERWNARAAELMQTYDARFGGDPAAGYGAYAWPARLYPSHERFKNIPAQKPSEWRYFALAAAHQALLAGNRETAARTLLMHFDEPQLRGWYALDEGGGSAPGNWPKLRTTWRAEVAMPHAWAIAELWLLMRDSLVYEDGDRLVLLGGVPEEWLAREIKVRDLPTSFGRLSFTYRGGKVTMESEVKPPGGFVYGVR
jgi:hypothetical protein